jgi:hypothetical protein
MSTRRVGISRREPAVFAPTAPAIIKPATVKPKIERVIDLEVAAAPVVIKRAPINGIKPPMAKEIADAIEAWTGRALL